METATTKTNTPAKTASLSLRELTDRFLQSRQYISNRTGRYLSPKTLRYYRMCLSGLLYFAAQEDWPAPAQLTRDHLRSFMHYLTNEPCRWAGDGRRATYKPATPATVHHYLKVAKTFFTWCQEEDYLPESPAQRFRVPPADYKDVTPYTDPEVAAMLDTCEHDLARGNRYLGARNRAVISVFIDTGLRLTELAGMKLSELDPHLQQVRVLGKGAKLRVVPINGEARKALKVYLTQYRAFAEATAGKPEDAVWLTEDGRPMTFHGIRIMIDRLKRRAGVKSGGSAHRFRHYFATRYLEAGGDMNALRLLLGHETLYMVLKYTKFVDARRALSSHASFSPLDHLVLQAKDAASRPGGNDGWGWRGVK
jgi:site-specific recombinase XerD